MITSPCNVYPLAPHFYIIVKLTRVFRGIYFFLIFALKHRSLVLVRTASVLTCTTIYVLSKNKKNIAIFHLKIIIFTAVKYYSILYGRVFVMIIMIIHLFSWLEKICAMTDREVPINAKLMDKPPDKSFSRNGCKINDANMENDASCPPVDLDKMTRYCQRGQKPGDLGKFVDFDVGTSVASPMSIRTDLSLDTGPVDSPYIVIPLNCSSEEYKESNFSTANAMLTPCPNVASPEVTFTELTPVKVAKPLQTSPLDFSGTGNFHAIETENRVPITNTGSVSITDIVTSGNVISIATAEPVSITDVIATANGISIATAEPISLTPINSVSNNNFAYAQELNTCDMNEKLVSKRSIGPNAKRSLLNGEPNNKRDMISERPCEADYRTEPLGISPDAAYCSAANHFPRQFDQEVTTKTEEKPAKRKRNRRKPDPDELPLAPPVTILPPCAICGSKSSGFHYGANTCEACKVYTQTNLFGFSFWLQNSHWQ